VDCNTKGSRRDDFPLQGDLGFCKELAVMDFFLLLSLGNVKPAKKIKGEGIRANH